MSITPADSFVQDEIIFNFIFRYLFWTDWGEEPKIERAGMDGSLSTRTVIVDDNIFWPNGLTLDYKDWRVYWADAKYNYIHSCTYDGRDRKVVISKRSDEDPSLPHPFALTMMDDFLYWTDWHTKAIHTCNKNTGIEGKVILNEIHSPMDIHVFDGQRQAQGELSVFDLTPPPSPRMY